MTTPTVTPEQLDAESAAGIPPNSLVPDDTHLTPEQVAQPPQRITRTARRGGKLYVAGEGKLPSEIVFVATSVFEEEAAESLKTNYAGVNVRSKPRCLKGPAGVIFKDICGSVGLDLDDFYYTALVKHLLPRQERTKPKRPTIEWGMPALMNELKEAKPKIIVCLGKPVFDALFPGFKLKFSDLWSAWFWHEELQAKVYVCNDLSKLVFKPETIERFRTDMIEVHRLWKCADPNIPTVPEDYRIVHNMAELETMVQTLEAERANLLSIDCEWKGRNHVDGELRSLQIGIAPGRAWYIRFMDDKGQYAFDAPYAEAGKVLARHWNKLEVGLCGHHIAADLPWTHHVLGLNYIGKTTMDTEFAVQVVDEYEPLGLERLSLRYTTLGRYDIPLLLWRKKNKGDKEDGFGFIPDDILIPYACKDVDVVIRAVPRIFRELSEQELLHYYATFVNPFVSDIFSTFALEGLDMDINQMDALRRVYHYGKRRLNEKFQQRLHREAIEALRNELVNLKVEDPEELMEFVLDATAQGNMEAATAALKAAVPGLLWEDLEVFYTHLLEAPTFNIRSTDQMRRWLFQVRRFRPVKSTNQKEKGLPSIPWDRVEELPADAQKEYKPSTDKQTLKILGAEDSTVQELLRLNAVGNICKAFLKEADTEEVETEEGETAEQVIRENGLHYWLASDMRIHGQMSCTETGRPRSWNPNAYNLPSWVNGEVSQGLAEVLKEDADKGSLEAEFQQYLEGGVPSIRSCVWADSQWGPILDYAKTATYEELLAHANTIPGLRCFVESDFVTAEVRGLAFQSGDANLIRLLTEPDTQFVKTKDGNVTRVAYGADCGIPPKSQLPVLLLAKTDSKGKITGYYTGDELETDEHGYLVSPSHDLHWSLAELVKGQPRELLSGKIDRNGLGKTGNFKTMYGAGAASLEAQIEAATGVKPEEGTGERIIEALAKRQPVAEDWLKLLEVTPETEAFWVAASGRKRHFATHPDNISGISGRMRKSVLSSLGRQMRNFPMQNSVGDTAARAAVNLLRHYRSHGMDAIPLLVLYDSVVTRTAVKDRFEVAKLHQRYMTDENTWQHHGRVWNYPAEHEFVERWSAKSPELVKRLLKDPAFTGA